jgi:hypothetical protein
MECIAAAGHQVMPGGPTGQDPGKTPDFKGFF